MFQLTNPAEPKVIRRMRRVALLPPVVSLALLVNGALWPTPRPIAWWMWAVAFVTLTIAASVIIAWHRTPPAVAVFTAAISYPALVRICSYEMESAMRSANPAIWAGAPPVSLGSPFNLWFLIAIVAMAGGLWLYQRIAARTHRPSS